jgi:glycosyltransferase involved in cell wall biosynthesis
MVGAVGAASDGEQPAKLNWRGTAARFLRKASDALVFADGRSLWVPAARRIGAQLMSQLRPDVVMAMHEPAGSLQVVRTILPEFIPFLADLADPVLASYTPWHWRRRALALEAWAMARADEVTVTDMRTANLLEERHGPRARPTTLLTQGFVAAPRVDVMPKGAARTLRLVYTGRLYPFRPIEPLLTAMGRVDGVELHIAGPELPPSVHAAAASSGGRVRIAGDLDHAQALALQSSADVLLGIGNAGLPQIPGKVFEYFGCQAPILYLYADPSDPVPDLIEDLGRGIACPHDPDAIAAALEAMLLARRAGQPALGFDLDPERVRAYEWSEISGRLADVISGMVLR